MNAAIAPAYLHVRIRGSALGGRMYTRRISVLVMSMSLDSEMLWFGYYGLK